MSPSKNIIAHDTYVQTPEGIPRRRVDALRITVKSTIEIASENVTIYGYHLLFSPIDHARMSGKTGSTQGARMVRIPAMKDMNASENMNFIDQKKSLATVQDLGQMDCLC